MAATADAALQAVVRGTGTKTFVFVFPMASGHINPSLSVARQLVQLGHRAHYVCFEQFRGAIEDTGATYHAATEVEPELFEGRKPDAFGALTTLMAEYGLTDFVKAMAVLRLVMHELQLPGLVRFLRQMEADAVICCPLFNWEACLAAKALGIPAIGILTVAGPGCTWSTMESRLKAMRLTFEDLDRFAQEYEPAKKAIANMNAQYGLDLQVGLPKPYGLTPAMATSALILVTTLEELQEDAPPELFKAYDAAGANFQYVGPLLDVTGARRAGVHHEESHGAATGAAAQAAMSDTELLERVRAARKAGQPVVLVSMGTVLTSDSKVVGWAAKPAGADGVPRGLTGCQLCRSAWAGTFDALGTERAEDGPLLVVSLGSQEDPLGEVAAPANAICVPCVPQVDILKEHIQLFLTHGGQNSFIESLSHGTPMVVCPGFGDQILNSQKAVSLGIGLKVDRPDPEPGCESAACAAYRREVSDSMAAVLGDESYAKAARVYAERLIQAGGTDRAVKLVLKTTESSGRPQPVTKQLSLAEEEQSTKQLCHAGA